MSRRGAGKVMVVAQREFLTTVRRKSYLITTLGMPLFVAMYGLFIGFLVTVISRGEAQTRSIGIVDHARALGLEEETDYSLPAPPQLEQMVPPSLAGPRGEQTLASALKTATGLRLVPFPSLEEASAALRADRVSSVLEFPADYLATGEVKSYQKEAFLTSKGAIRGEILNRFVVERLLRGKIDPVLLERVRQPLRTVSYTLQKDGTFARENVISTIASFVVPLVFTVLFFISVMMSSGFMLQGVSEEKENRVIEVILSSIDSDRLLLGKLIGLGGAGLLQVSIWFGLVLIPSAALIVRLPISLGPVAWSFVFYLLGFLFFGVLMMGTGCLGQNAKESQQYGMIWSLGTVIPMAFLMLILKAPNGTLARVLSFVPFTAPVTMFLRLNSSTPPPWWEAALAGAILALSFWLALRFMAKIFRVGLLLYGKRPTIPEIFRMMAAPGRQAPPA